MERKARCLYIALLKNSCELRKMIGFYEEYNDLRSRIMNSVESPIMLKSLFLLVKTPKYLIFGNAEERIGHNI
jgi:hypothetical protein